MLIFTVFASDSNYSDDELDNLIRKVADGDMKSFESLYYLTKTKVFSFAYSILKDRSDAEDITHDVYLSIYKSAKLYKENNSPMGWIITITKNLSYRKLNSNKKTTDIHDNILTYPDNTELSDDKLVLLECINKLSSEESQIIVLHVVSGFKHDEIGKILSLPAATVRSKYSRALKKLREELSKGGAFNE